MPLEVCKLSRAYRAKSRHGDSVVSPDYGYCATQATHYFGYKIHAVCTVQGVFKAYDISPASTHDIHYLNDVKAQFSECVLVENVETSVIFKLFLACLEKQGNVLKHFSPNCVINL